MMQNNCNIIPDLYKEVSWLQDEHQSLMKLRHTTVSSWYSGVQSDEHRTHWIPRYVDRGAKPFNRFLFY